MKKLLPLLICFFSLSAISAPNVLSNSDHAASNIQSALTALSISGVVVNQTCASPCGSAIIAPGSPFILFALGAGPFYALNSSTVVNHQPYTVLTESTTNYSEVLDQQNYNTLETNGIIYSMPHCPTMPLSPDYPPVTMVNVLPAGASSHTVATCGYDGGTEFSLSANYLYAGSTGSPSATGATMAGILAAMKNTQSTWNWFDIKGALRQTASNWATGWTQNNGGALGYGNVNYAAASTLASTANIFLQAPGFVVINHGYYAQILLYPFATTRRVKEEIFVGGSWPAASTINEMTATQVTAAGGTHIAQCDNTGTTAFSCSYAVPATGSATFTALTLDASGNGSRVESFSQITQSFVVGVACLN